VLSLSQQTPVSLGGLRIDIGASLSVPLKLHPASPSRKARVLSAYGADAGGIRRARYSVTIGHTVGLASRWSYGWPLLDTDDILPPYGLRGDG
jgi:hypothetical protein